MPGRGTEPGEALYRECGSAAGVRWHRQEKTRTCQGCREVQRRQMAAYRIRAIVAGPRQVPAVGLRRRVQALARQGWGQREVAERIGLKENNFRKMFRQQMVGREVHERVRVLYPVLVWQDGPNHLARCYAVKKGWPGPMDWDDPDDPAEVPACEIERAHRAALEMARGMRKNTVRREARQQQRPDLRVLAGGRQAEAVTPMRTAMAT